MLEEIVTKEREEVGMRSDGTQSDDERSIPERRVEVLRRLTERLEKVGGGRVDCRTRGRGEGGGGALRLRPRRAAPVAGRRGHGRRAVVRRRRRGPRAPRRRQAG